MLLEKVVVLVSEPWVNKCVCISFQNHPFKVQMCGKVQSLPFGSAMSGCTHIRVTRVSLSH